MNADPLERIPPAVRSALHARGYTSLTPVQEAVLDPALEGHDLRISSQTGSGKTLAIALVLSPLLAAEPAGKGGGCAPQAIVVTPTRELAAQVQGELGWVLAGDRRRIVSVTGGTSVRAELAELSRGADIVVGTPGRLLDHLERHAIDTSGVRAIVLDEADQMLDLGFREALEAILGKMPEDRRTHLVSATFSREVLGLANRYQKDAEAVEGTRLGAANADIEHLLHLVPHAHRTDAVINLLLLDPNERALVFVRTREGTAELAEALVEAGFAAAALSGDMDQEDRTRTLAAFRSGFLRTLVATDVAARGIDVPDIARVIHADPPGDPETYTHRSGRTGRVGRKGTSHLILPPQMRMRVEVLLRRAGVRATPRPVPSADEIRRRADDRLVTAMSAPPDDPDTVPDARRKLAVRLLTAVEPLPLVIRLLERLGHDGPSAPRVIPTPPPREERSFDRRDPRDAGPRSRGDAPHGAHAPREGARFPREGGPREGAPPREREARGDGRWVGFRINWGSRSGADPRRLLALVCRRGGIRGADVGSIQIGPMGSTFEVAESVAGDFARAARQPDERDPRIRIEEASGASGERPSGPRAVERRPPQGARPWEGRPPHAARASEGPPRSSDDRPQVARPTGPRRPKGPPKPRLT